MPHLETALKHRQRACMHEAAALACASMCTACRLRHHCCIVLEACIECTLLKHKHYLEVQDWALKASSWLICGCHYCKRLDDACYILSSGYQALLMKNCQYKHHFGTCAECNCSLKCGPATLQCTSEVQARSLCDLCSALMHHMPHVFCAY